MNLYKTHFIAFFRLRITFYLKNSNFHTCSEIYQLTGDGMENSLRAGLKLSAGRRLSTHAVNTRFFIIKP